MSIILIYVTHENEEQARKITSHLLEKKLIACVNFFPITCSYWWQGKIENSNEIVSLLKTKTEHWDTIKTEIKKLHPYTTPCIIKIESEANKEYEKWVNKTTL